jgi:ribosome-binding factor A
VRSFRFPASHPFPSFSGRIPVSRRVCRKNLQLCAQVREALYFVLGATVGDDALALLQVLAVEPLPDASRLLVTLTAPTDVRPEDASARLLRAAKAIRAEVAASIHRRKAPELVFRVVPS